MVNCDYLGSAFLSHGGTGLGSVQTALRQLYCDYREKPHNCRRTVYIDSSHISIADVIVPLEDVAWCDAVQFTVKRAGSRGQYRAAFLSITGEVLSAARTDRLFKPLSNRYLRFVSHSHPTLFICVMRRQTGIRALECHAFATETRAEALELVQCVKTAQLHQTDSNLFNYSPHQAGIPTAKSFTGSSHYHGNSDSSGRKFGSYSGPTKSKDYDDPTKREGYDDSTNKTTSTNSDQKYYSLSGGSESSTSSKKLHTDTGISFTMLRDSDLRNVSETNLTSSKSLTELSSEKVCITESERKCSDKINLNNNENLVPHPSPNKAEGSKKHNVFRLSSEALLRVKSLGPLRVTRIDDVDCDVSGGDMSKLQGEVETTATKDGSKPVSQPQRHSSSDQILYDVKVNPKSIGDTVNSADKKSSKPETRKSRSPKAAPRLSLVAKSRGKEVFVEEFDEEFNYVLTRRTVSKPQAALPIVQRSASKRDDNAKKSQPKDRKRSKSTTRIPGNGLAEYKQHAGRGVDDMDAPKFSFDLKGMRKWGSQKNTRDMELETTAYGDIIDPCLLEHYTEDELKNYRSRKEISFGKSSNSNILFKEGSKGRESRSRRTDVRSQKLETSRPSEPRLLQRGHSAHLDSLTKEAEIQELIAKLPPKLTTVDVPENTDFAESLGYLP